MSFHSIWNEKPRCNVSVYWYNGEYEGECERDPEHEGDHFDGMNWFNGSNEEGEPDESYDVSTGVHARWTEELRKEQRR